MPYVFFSARTYQIGLLTLFAALLATFFRRAEYFDEAWFAEQSFWLIRDGRVRSELFRGYNGWEAGLYVYHKLFVYAGAVIMSITGITLAASKLVSIFFGLAGGGLVWLHGRNTARERQCIALFLYAGCGTFIRYVSVNRPETMCMALGFASYLALDPPGPIRSKPIAAGILAGLSVLTHLNGLIYVSAGASWLLIKSGWRSAFLFSTAAFIIISFYGLDALLDGRMMVLVNQFLHDPATQQNFHLADKLNILINFHQIFFYGLYETALTVFVLLCAIACRKQLAFRQPVLLYTVLLIGSFWLLTKGITDIYFLLFLPWLAILPASWLTAYVQFQPVWQKTFVRILLVGYGCIAIIQLAAVLKENRALPDTEAHNARLASYMPHKQTAVITPLEFFFGQMEHYRIRGLTYYLLLEQEKGRIPLAKFFWLANRDQVEYIVSDHRLNASYDIPVNAPARIGVYRRVFQDQWNTIYARIPDKR